MSKSNEEIIAWSNAPSRENDLSSKTYGIIKKKLEEKYGSDVDIFLQGSYANSTNIKRDSDIDIVICYNNSFFYDISKLTDDDKKKFDSNLTKATYTFADYKNDIEAFLISIFGDQVERKNKCIKISGNGYRVDADVVPCFKHKRYSSFNEVEAEGIALNSDDGENIVSFPKQHIKNGENKNKQTKEVYKKFVRIIKNCKKELISKSVINDSLVSSFLLECLIWNIPNSIFMKNNTYKECLNEVISLLYNDMGKSDKYSDYAEVCDLFYLFRGNRSKSTPFQVRDFLEKVYNLINN